MTAIISLLIIVTITLVVTRIATIVLVHTGLSHESARFQARSAMSGVGFTTKESESVVNHPVRRRIVMLLMLFGNTTIVTVMASLILTFILPQDRPGSLYYRILILACGLLLLWSAARSKWVDKQLSRLIIKALNRWTDLELRDYATLLHLADNHQILEMTVKSGDWLANRSLAELALSDEGVIVIGVQRSDGTYVGGPHGGTRIEAGDVLLMYGKNTGLHDLDERRSGRAGDEAHRLAVEAQKNILQEQGEHERSRAKEGNAPPPADPGNLSPEGP